jgi:hypothetical protein
MSIQADRHYVILKHTRPDDIHWDFMLESGEQLSTWRMSIPPEQISCNGATAEKIFDHSKKFLTYQGPVNKGKGNVTIEDEGMYSVISEGEDELQICIKAKILNGNYYLVRKSQDSWQLRPL